MPEFVQTLINPFINLISYVGFPVEKRESFNPFIDDNTIFDQEINAKVREMNEFELETPAKVVEIIDSHGKINFNPTIDAMERFECGPEIPVLLVDKDKQNFIMRSTSRENVFNWDQYQKVSDIIIRDEFGYETTLERMLAGISQVKKSNVPLRFRPVPSMIQGGLIEGGQSLTIEQPITIEPNYVETSTPRQNISMCDDDIIKTRPHFPVYG